MEFPKSGTFPTSIVRSKIMGPNPLKLAEELLDGAEIAAGAVVLDLGSGTGITSALMAREYDFTVYAADLWSEPGDNMRFFESLGLTNRQISIPGMVRDCHDDLPACLLASWTPEQLDYMHDMAWWRATISQTEGVEIVDMHEMACTREAWADWIACDNEYARGDRAAVEAGALEFLNTIAVTLRRA